MNNSITYYPYKKYKYFYIFVRVLQVLVLFLLLTTVLWGDGKCIFEAGMLLVCEILCVVLHREGSIRFVFNDEGIKVFQKNNLVLACDWFQLKYAYYTKNKRGFLHVVLTDKMVNDDCIKRYTHCCLGKYRNILAIYLDMTQDVSQIEEIIRRKVQVM